jgi:hypothetical protein
MKARLAKIAFQQIQQEGGRFLQKITRTEAKNFATSPDANDTGLVVIRDDPSQEGPRYDTTASSAATVPDKDQLSFYQKVDERQILLKIKQSIRFLVDQREDRFNRKASNGRFRSPPPNPKNPRCAQTVGCSSVGRKRGNKMTTMISHRTGASRGAPSADAPMSSYCTDGNMTAPAAPAPISATSARHQEALELLLSLRSQTSGTSRAWSSTSATAAVAADATGSGAMGASLVRPPPAASRSGGSSNANFLSLLELMHQQQHEQALRSERLLLGIIEQNTALERERHLLRLMADPSTASTSHLLQSLWLTSPSRYSPFLCNSNGPSLETLQMMNTAPTTSGPATRLPVPSSSLSAILLAAIQQTEQAAKAKAATNAAAADARPTG